MSHSCIVTPSWRKCRSAMGHGSTSSLVEVFVGDELAANSDELDGLLLAFESFDTVACDVANYNM